MNETYDFELGVTGSVLIDSRCLPALLDIVRPEHFTNSTYREIYSAAVSLFERGIPADLLTIIDELKGRGFVVENGVMAEIMSLTPTAANAVLYAKKLEEAFKMRRVREVLTSAACDNLSSAEELTDLVVSSLCEISAGDFRNKAVHISEAAQGLWSWTQKDEDKRLFTGYTRLDAVLGGFSAGNLAVAAARPAVGKSAFAASLAYKSAEKGVKTIIFSCEMSNLEITQRYIADMTGFKLDEVRGRTYKDTGMKEFSRRLADMSKLPLYLCDKPGITVLDVRRELQRHRDIGLVVIDYMQLMESTERAANRNLELAKISGGLKRLAKEFDLPVIALSQLNRGADECSEPSLTGLRDSGAIEQDADVAILLWRLEPKEDGLLDKIGVKVAKNRMGKTGTVVMYFDGEHMRFCETSEEYRPKRRGRGRDFVPVDPYLPEGW